MEVETSIRFERTRLVIMAWPDRSYTHELAVWARNFPPENVFVVCHKEVCAARNLAVRELCKNSPPQIEHFIFIDRDMRPGEAVLPFLTPEADLVGCGYSTGNDTCWAEVDAIHCGLFRVTRKLVDALPLPWFAFSWREDGALAKCECANFKDKVKAAGFGVARAGWCGHKDWR